MRLTAEQIETYRRDGVLPVGRVLSDEQVREARERVERMIERELVDRPNSTPGKHTIRRLNMSQTDPWFGTLVRLPGILDIAESVLGPDIQFYQDNLFYKPAGVGDETQWHQDNIWWHADPPSMLTIWIALDDVDDNNGAVRYIRGSQSRLIEHTLPVRDPQGFSYNMLDPGRLELGRAVSFVVPAGHGVMHHCLTAHGAPFNQSNRPRRGYTVTLQQAGLTSADQEKFPVLRGRMPAVV
jgi:phytanoyl-CoA hydroxylase